MAECRGLAPHSPFGSPLFSKQVRPARPVDIPNLSAWGAHARKLVHPAGLPPANSPFEAEDDNSFTTDAEMEPMERFALSWGKCARQFTKLLLSLLSHIGEMVGRHGAAPCSAV